MKNVPFPSTACLGQVDFGSAISGFASRDITGMATLVEVDWLKSSSVAFLHPIRVSNPHLASPLLARFDFLPKGTQ
jgi:hypothetical protein